jgi:hypothetical protein
LFACVVTDSALEGRVKGFGTSVIETVNPQKLKEFRALVLTKMVRFWEDSKDIKISIGETLSHFSRRDELTGWVRANQEANMPALADEIARLSKENALLCNQIASNNPLNTFKGLNFDELRTILDGKGLLEPLTKIRPHLGSEFGVSHREAPRDALLELTVLGLLTANAKISPTHYQLTEAGQSFLNRLELQRLNPSIESGDKHPALRSNKMGKGTERPPKRSKKRSD